MLPCMSDDLNNVSCVGLALGAYNSDFLVNAAKNLSKITVATNEGDMEAVLIDAMLVGSGVRTLD